MPLAINSTAIDLASWRVGWKQKRSGGILVNCLVKEAWRVISMRIPGSGRYQAREVDSKVRDDSWKRAIVRVCIKHAAVIIEGLIDQVVDEETIDRFSEEIRGERKIMIDRFFYDSLNFISPCQRFTEGSSISRLCRARARASLQDCFLCERPSEP